MSLPTYSICIVQVFIPVTTELYMPALGSAFTNSSSNFIHLSEWGEGSSLLWALSPLQASAVVVLALVVAVVLSNPTLLLPLAVSATIHSIVYSKKYKNTVQYSSSSMQEHTIVAAVTV